MSAEEAEKKFKLLRSDFTRYQRRMKSLPSGSGRDAAVRAEKYECFQWLLPYIDHRKTTTNFPQQLHILNNSTNYPCSYSTSRRSPSSNSTTTSNSLDNEHENRDEVLVTGLTESSIIIEDEESNVLEKASDDEKVSGLSQVQSGDVGTDKRPWCKSNRKRVKND